MKFINNEINNALLVKRLIVSEKTGKVSIAKAGAVFRTYRDLRRDGWLNVKQSMVERTFLSCCNYFLNVVFPGPYYKT